jgi:hypothetical protein
MMRKASHTYALWNGQVHCSLCWVRRQKCPLGWPSNGPSLIVEQLFVLLGQAYWTVFNTFRFFLTYNTYNMRIKRLYRYKKRKCCHSIMLNTFRLFFTYNTYNTHIKRLYRYQKKMMWHPWHGVYQTHDSRSPWSPWPRLGDVYLKSSR